VAILNASVAFCRLGELVEEAAVETSSVEAFAIVSCDSTEQRQFQPRMILVCSGETHILFHEIKPSSFDSGSCVMPLRSDCAIENPLRLGSAASFECSAGSWRLRSPIQSL
jgi:hypothetical protein